MATKVLDPVKVKSLIERYVPVTIAPSATRVLLQHKCPSTHADENPSYTYNPEIDRGTCKGCPYTGNLHDTIRFFEQSVSDVNKLIKDHGCYVKVVREKAPGGKANALDVPEAQIKKWQEDLQTDTQLQVLMKRWGWTEEMVHALKLGASEGRLVIPMYERGTLVNVKFYTPGATARKYESKAGAHIGVWPFHMLDHKELILVEGEKDCMTLLAAGFNAATFTGGANSIATQYLCFFAGKRIYVVYDIDEAGRTGSANVCKALSRMCENVYNVDLPPNILPAKGDITDLYMADPEQFADRVRCYLKNTTPFQSANTLSRVHIPHEVAPTYLESIVSSKLYHRRVGFHARVVNNAKNEVSLVPKEVVMHCHKDFKPEVCSICPMFYASGIMPILIKPEYPEVLSIIGNNMKKQRDTLKSLCDIPLQCPRCTVEYKSHQAMYPIVIIPSIEANKTSHDYSLVTAWALDVPAKENEDYAAEAVVLANPETQRMCLVCYRMDHNRESLEDFELAPEMIEKLEIFKCLMNTNSG